MALRVLTLLWRYFYRSHDNILPRISSTGVSLILTPSTQGGGSWFAIELPEVVSMSGIKLWFLNPGERQQKLTVVSIGTDEVLYKQPCSVHSLLFHATAQRWEKSSIKDADAPFSKNECT